MRNGRDLSALADALKGFPDFAKVTAASLAPLNFKGLAHDHLAVAGHDVLLRVPKQSQFALAAADNLERPRAAALRGDRAHARDPHGRAHRRAHPRPPAPPAP
jgi:hypothetical protein